MFYVFKAKLKRSINTVSQTLEQNNIRISKITAKIYKKSTGIKVDESKLKDFKNDISGSQYCDQFRQYYRNITEDDQKVAITSTFNTNLNKSINTKEIVDEKIPVTTSEMIESNIKGKKQFPNKHDILKSSNFGKPSKDHSFTSESCFEHTIIFILKSEYIDNSDKENLSQSHLLFQHLKKMVT